MTGATAEKVLRSSWSHPTGTELKQAKFGGAGPWQDVDWNALRKKTKSVLALVKGALGGVQPVGLRVTWSLPAAAERVRAGARELVGEYSSTPALPE
ncbi:MAG: hypothetical protein ABI969_20140 [bacterium]